MGWTVETLNRNVDAEIADLPDDMRARLARIAELIEAHGIQAVPAVSVKQLEGKLWELRIRGRQGIARAIYVTAAGERVVIVRAFLKKSRKRLVGSCRLPGKEQGKSNDSYQGFASPLDGRRILSPGVRGA